SHRGTHYELVKAMLSSIIDSSEVAKNIPEEVIKLASLFWFSKPSEDTYPFSDYRIDMEQYFGLESRGLDYYPASSFQTPVWALLQTDPQKTVDFILSFTNRAVECFLKSELGDEAKEIDVLIDDSGSKIKQYVCHRLWNIYRGT